MTTTYEGQLSLGECIPSALTAQGKIDAAVGVALPDVQARIAGLAAAKASITANPPTLGALIEAASAIVASLQAALAAGFEPPKAQLDAVIDATAALELVAGQLTAALNFSASLSAQLGAPGIHYYLCEGQAPDLGNELKTQLGGGLPNVPPSSRVAGALLLAADAEAIAALRSVLRS